VSVLSCIIYKDSFIIDCRVKVLGIRFAVQSLVRGQFNRNVNISKKPINVLDRSCKSIRHLH
jgi:hypothetical protein